MFSILHTDLFFVNMKHYFIAFYLWKEGHSASHRLAMQEIPHHLCGHPSRRGPKDEQRQRDQAVVDLVFINSFPLKRWKLGGTRFFGSQHCSRRTAVCWSSVVITRPVSRTSPQRFVVGGQWAVLKLVACRVFSRLSLTWLRVLIFIVIVSIWTLLENCDHKRGVPSKAQVYWKGSSVGVDSSATISRTLGDKCSQTKLYM